MVAAPRAQVLLWGPQGVLLYNDAYAAFAGARHPDLLGRPHAEGWPEIAGFNDDNLRRALAGESWTLRDQELVLDRGEGPLPGWMDLDYVPVRDERGRPAGLMVFVTETTERRVVTRALQESEARLRFLDDLTVAAQGAVDPQQILSVVTRMTARHLGVTNCAYADMDPDQDGFTIRGDWAAPGTPSIVGRYRLADFGALAVQELGAGRPLIINDNLKEIAPEEAATFQALGISATICMPLVKEGRLLALMAVHHKDPHVWTTAELATIREVTARCWAHIERVRDEVALRESERRYRMLFDTIDEGFCILEFIDGPHGPLSDYVHVEANDAYQTNTGIPDIVGKRLREVLGREGQEWIDLFKGVLETGRSIRFEKALEETGRWLELAAFRLEPASRNQVAVLFKDLTARRKAELALRESEERFRNMADNTPMMTWVTDPTGYCTYLNRTWYAFTGQTAGEAEGYGWLDATHPDDKARAEEAFVTAHAAQAPFKIEYRLRRADGTYRWAIDAASPRFDAAGAYLGYVGSVIDIDDRREMEDALRASEAELRALNADLEKQVAERVLERGTTWDVAPDMLSVISLTDGRFVRVNPAWEAVLGWPADRLEGRPYVDFLHPEDVEASAAAFAQVQAGEPVLKFENRYRARDGGWRRLNWVAVPEAGKLYSSARDVTEDRARADERDRLWSLSADMLARADLGGGMSAVNPAWTRVLGWPEQDLLTRPYADIIHPADGPATLAALTRMGETGEPTRFQNRILSRDGGWKPIDWTVAPEPDGENFIAVGRDLTADKAREAELQAAQEALRQSQKMEAVGQLTGGIAHDFNNLLAGIIGSLELLGKRLSEGRLGGMERYIEAAQGSAQRAASLTQRLLAFSRRQTLDPRATDVNRLIAGMEELIRRSVGPNVELEVVGAGGLWTTRIDQPQLENALLNLCINARDAMAPDGGRLTIETANKWLDERHARERDLPPGQYVSLCVTDTGTGMTPEVQAQAFDPFFTTKPLGQGTGLGLSMIHGFVRQSGGQVRIYSEVGEGTTMCLYLPRWTGDLDAEEAPSAPTGPEAGHGETILVIDDEPTVRMLVAEVLIEAGYRVLEAADGPSGLDLLRSDARIDLLVSDVGLPGGMNGRQVADAARVARPGLRVLFMTGYAENAAVGNGLLDPGMEVLTKPFVMADLANKVREMIDG
ncbi:MAG: PAS domain S-box protein [Alphaproteobacteria bacterium]|nr:PAS domain S-box protein [Alphaproteobacteria bacterium]